MESTKDFGNFGIFPQNYCTHQAEANKVSVCDNINNETGDAVNNVNKAHSDMSVGNRNANENHCMPWAVIDVIIISGQSESLVKKTKCHPFCLALIKKMNL